MSAADESIPALTLSTTEDSNRLRYSPDKIFVILRTRIGDMNLASNEFNFYQLLFKVADVNNTGRLTSTNSHLTTLLNRTKLSTLKIDTILSHVNGRANAEGSEVPGLSFNQWLVMCRLIAYTQTKSLDKPDFIPQDDALEKILTEQLPVCDFSFGKTSNAPQLAFTDDFECEFNGYKVHGEGFQQQHIKFTILTVTKTTMVHPSAKAGSPSVITPLVKVPSNDIASPVKPPRTKKKGDNAAESVVTVDAKGVSKADAITKSSNTLTVSATVKGETQNAENVHNHPNGRHTITTHEIVRRYSDFELLAVVLQRFYTGCIVPPIPPKAWGFSSVSDEIGVQRSRELQMFLRHIIRHPFLRHTYEVKAFLEASAAGFRAFRELFPRLQEGVYPLSLPNTILSQLNNNSSIVGNIIDVTSSSAVSVAATVTSSLANTKAYGFVSNLIGTVKNVISIPKPAVAGSTLRDNSHVLDQRLRDTLKFEENIGKTAAKLEQVMNTEGKMIFELSMLGYYLKQMADYGTDLHYGGADVDIQHTCHHLELVVNNSHVCHDYQVKNSLSPMQYMGRYAESVKSIVHTKEILIKDTDSAVNKEDAARKVLDQANASMTQSKLVISIYKDQHEDASIALQTLKKRNDDMESRLEEDLTHVQSVTTIGLQRCTEAFVRSRVESCQKNVEILEKLKKIIVESKSWRPEVSGILVLDEFV